MGIISCNGVLKTADGKILKYADKVNTISKVAGISNNDYITIFLTDLEDPDQPGVSTLDRIKDFLSGDLSTISWEYDRVRNYDLDTVLSHETEYFTGFCTDAVISKYKPEQYAYYRYHIFLKRSDEAYKKALQDHEDILALYDAIAERYEESLTL